MRIKSLLTWGIFGAGLFFMQASAQQVMFTPSTYVFPVDAESAPIMGQAGQDFWMVFSDRSNNTMYSDESCRVSTGDPVKFMQSFIVITQSADQSALKVVDNKFVTERGTLKEGYQSHSGWMKKSNLLLSRRCLKTRNAKLPGFENGYSTKGFGAQYHAHSVRNYEPPTYYSIGYQGCRCSRSPRSILCLKKQPMLISWLKMSL
jgi:hypothetical protein